MTGGYGNIRELQFLFLGSAVTSLAETKLHLWMDVEPSRYLQGKLSVTSQWEKSLAPLGPRGHSASLILGMISLWTELFCKRRVQRSHPFLFQGSLLSYFFFSKWVPCFDGANWPNYTNN